MDVSKATCRFLIALPPAHLLPLFWTIPNKSSFGIFLIPVLDQTLTHSAEMAIRWRFLEGGKYAIYLCAGLCLDLVHPALCGRRFLLVWHLQQ